MKVISAQVEEFQLLCARAAVEWSKVLPGVACTAGCGQSHLLSL